MKKHMPTILGNQRLRDQLCHDILGGTMAHAYILAGPRGSGKHTLAMQCAAAVACESKKDQSAPFPCGVCPACRKILDGKSPDVITIKKDGQSVKIDQIRALQTDVRKVPNDLDDKFYVIEDAHTMTEEAQNAFLLTLEEPPVFVHFFLLCDTEEALLETVRSRAPVLRTEPLPAEMVRAHLMRIAPEAAGLSAAALDDLLAIANGSVGRALELLDEKEREPLIKQRRTAQSLAEYALDRKFVPLIELVNAVGAKQDEWLPLLSLTQVVLRDLIALKRSETAPLCFYTDRAAALERAYGHSVAALLGICDTLATAEERISRNANIKLTLTAMIAKL